MSFIKTTFVTKNSVGIISKITKDIFINGINIDYSQMITKDNILIYNVETPYNDKEKMYNIFKQHNCDDLATLIYTNTNINNNKHYKKIIRISCFDNPGVIHSSSDVLNNLKINIDSLISNSESAPTTGSKVFNLNMNLSIPNHIDDYVIRKSFEPIISKYNIDLELE